MPLPNPTYLTTQYWDWDGTQEASLLVKTNGTTLHMFRWKEVFTPENERIHNLIMTYVDKDGVVTEATATTLANMEAWIVADFNGTVVGGNATGLANDATVYTCTVVVDGTPIAVDVVGSAAQTFTALVSEINTDLGANATAAIDGNGNIDITSVTADNTSTVSIEDDRLFKFSTGFRQSFLTFHGITIFEDIFTFNTVFQNGKDTFTEMYAGLYHPVPPTPGKGNGPIDSTRVYFNHNTAAWTYLYNDVAVV